MQLCTASGMLNTQREMFADAFAAQVQAGIPEEAEMRRLVAYERGTHKSGGSSRRASLALRRKASTPLSNCQVLSCADCSVPQA